MRLAVALKVETGGLVTSSEVLRLVNSRINSSYDRVEAMLDATKEALIEEVEGLKGFLNSVDRQ